MASDRINRTKRNKNMLFNILYDLKTNQFFKLANKKLAKNATFLKLEVFINYNANMIYNRSPRFFDILRFIQVELLTKE